VGLGAAPPRVWGGGPAAVPGPADVAAGLPG